ncbi:MAG: adenylosuccinate lyase [Thermoleophilia bacterium]|nr:adenylosuccinate lyase [Thermoleophilia bacterium]
MISRYSRPEMAALFTDQARMDAWLRVEQAALRAMASEGIAPQSAADALGALEHVDVDRVQERERETRHDVAAFVDVIAQDAPDAAGWVHFGLTSSDVVDTALGWTLHRAGELVLDGMDSLLDAVARRALEHRDTVMLGRTHGMPAEVTTFGAKLVGWWHQLRRDRTRVAAAVVDIRVGKLSGAVGTYSGVGPAVERLVLGQLGLQRDPSATQVVQRDRHAALLGSLAIHAATLERIALEIRHLQRPEVGEASEPFATGQKGSSAMPHKRNPIVSEQVCGLARLVRANAGASIENVALWHERDISHSSIERVILPDTFTLVDYLLAKVTWLVDGMVVVPERMLENLAGQRGTVASQRVLLELVAAGLVRDDAYRAVQSAAAEVRSGARANMADALADRPAVVDALGIDRVRDLVDPTWVPDGIAAIYDEFSRAMDAAGVAVVVS